MKAQQGMRNTAVEKEEGDADAPDKSPTAKVMEVGLQLLAPGK